MAKLGKAVEEVGDGCAELVFGAVESGVDNLLARALSKALHQVSVGRIREQKHLANGLVGRPCPQLLDFVVAGIVAHDVDACLVGVGSEQLLVQAPRALGIDAAGLIEQHLRGLVSVEGRIQIDPLAAVDGEQRALSRVNALKSSQMLFQGLGPLRCWQDLSVHAK